MILSDSTWPHTEKIVTEQTRDLTPEQRYKVVRGTLDSSGVDKRRQARSRYGAKKAQ